MFLATSLTPVEASLRPLIVEEATQLTSPDPLTPLNGPAAVYGNRIIASSLVESGGALTWHVYLFERVDALNPWRFSQKLISFGATADQGRQLSVALSGDTAAVASGDRAYAIERTATGWLTTELPKPAQALRYGSDVETIGDMLVVGGLVGSLSTARVAGFVFRKQASGVWVFEADLIAGYSPYGGDFEWAGYYGPDLGIRPQQVVIGSPVEWHDDSPAPPGKLFVFRKGQDGQWLKTSELYDHVLPSSKNAGYQAALFPTAGIAAFSGHSDGASIFRELAVDDWVLEDNVRPIDTLMNDYSSALKFDTLHREPTLAMGEGWDEDRGAAAGSITLYQRQVGERWQAVAKLYASNAAPGHGLGRSLSMHGDTVVSAANNRVYVFQLPANLPEVAPPSIHDTFEDGGSLSWRLRSSWALATSRGSRVFQHVNTVGDGRAYLDGVDYADIAIEADVRPLAFNGSDRWVGLLTRYVDDNNHYVLSLRNSNVLRLSRRVNGSFQTLASTSLSVVAGRNYRIRLEAVGTWLRVYINGQLRLQARDSTFSRGSAGLRAYFTRAEFDNVMVTPSPAIRLLADSDDKTWRWTLESGNWYVDRSSANPFLRQSVASGPARAISGVPYETNDDRSADQIIEARTRPQSFITGQDPWFGLIARYQDNSNYIYVTVNRNGYVSLRKLENGAIRVLDTASMTVSTGTWYSLRLEAVGEHVRFYVNGALLLEGFDRETFTGSRGRYGLMTSRAAVDFDEIRVTQP